MIFQILLLFAGLLLRGGNEQPSNHSKKDSIKAIGRFIKNIFVCNSPPRFNPSNHSSFVSTLRSMKRKAFRKDNFNNHTSFVNNCRSLRRKVFRKHNSNPSNSTNDYLSFDTLFDKDYNVPSPLPFINFDGILDQALSAPPPHPFLGSVNGKSYIIPDSIVKKAVREECVDPRLKPSPGASTQIIYNDCVNFIEKREKLIQGLRDLVSWEKSASKEQSKLKPQHFLKCSQDALEHKLEFEPFNVDTFQRIRSILSIKEEEFRTAFDSDLFFDPQHTAFDPELSRTGRFRIECISTDAAYLLHRRAKQFKSYLRSHEQSELQRYIGLYRVGPSFFAIEDKQHPKSVIGPIQHCISFNSELQRFQQCVDTMSGKCKKKNVLLSDVNFLKTVCETEKIHVSVEITQK